MKYFGEIGNYSFIMEDENKIEVWDDLDGEYPITYIHADKIKNERDFHMEIMSWFSKNS